MTPPEPVRCCGYGQGEPPCEYVSRQGLPTQPLINQDLIMHSMFCTAVGHLAENQDEADAEEERFERPETGGKETSDEVWFSLAWERYKAKKGGLEAWEHYKAGRVDIYAARCKYCGFRGHGSKPNDVTRKAKCPAWSQECYRCKEKGHFARKCKKLRRPEVKSASQHNSETHDGQDDESEGNIVVGSLYGAGQLCKINWVQTSSGKGRLVPHHEWDGWGFVRQKPQRHPEVQVKASICREAYRQLKIKEPRKERVQNNVKAMPDTGAMMCLVGMNTMYNMGLRESDLVEVDMQVNAANSKTIPLLGGMFLDLELNGRSSKQLVYVTTEVHCLFLSQKACRPLCIVDDKFPDQVAKCTAVDDENETDEKCTCPKRQLLPSPPALPCPVIPKNA